MTKADAPAAGGPIFIGGLFKSGTTLLRAMIGQHPDIYAGLETHWFDLVWPHDPAEERQRLILQRLSGFHGALQADTERLLAQSSSAEAFIAAFLAQRAASAGKSRWCEKTPGNVLHIARILEHFPGSCLILVVRDPRDIMASFIEAQRPDRIAEFSRIWCDFVGRPERQWHGGELPLQRVVRVRYEDIVLDTEATMRRVLSAIRATWNPAAANFSGQSEDFDVVLSVASKPSTTLARLRNPMETGRIGLGRKRLSPELLATTVREIRDLGYGAELSRIVAEREAVTGAWAEPAASQSKA